MTPAEWDQVKTEVESLWGRSARWAKYQDAFRYAQPVQAAAAFQAVEQIYLENRKTTPAPADVLAAARHLVTDTVTPEEVTRTCANAGHVWVIVDETAGVRTGVCARCRVEAKKPAHEMPTEGEIEDGLYSGKASDPTERIAP